MKKLIGIALALVFAVALVMPAIHHAVEAAGNFSNWKCSQCGATRNMAGQNQPPTSGCKVSSDGKHIWFRVN